MTDLSGQYLGRYYLSERLGEGGMAVVYKGYDTRLERDVAVKIIRSGAFPIDAMGEVLKRFEREAKSLAKLSHPSIVKVYDYGEHEGAPYLVMEYLPGGTLKKILDKPVPWQEAVRLILPVARGVAYAHQRGVLHRDIKPANVLITESGEPMLSDFGIAKLFEGNQATALTGSGMAIGTPEYMAPEQWTGVTSPQSDLYSLGIVLYEMVTGRKPYVADTPAAILIKQATEPLPNPRRFAVDLPEELELVLIKALAKEPEDRYKDLKAFIGVLESLSVGMPVTSSPSPILTHSNSETEKMVVVPKTQKDIDLRGSTISQTRMAPAPKFSRKGMGLLIGGIVLVLVAWMLLPDILATPASTTATVTLTRLASTMTSVLSSSTSFASLPPTDILTPSETPLPTLAPGAVQVSPIDGMVMHYIPAGTFMMGDTAEHASAECERTRIKTMTWIKCDQVNFKDEEPIHQVYLDAFWMDETEVTNAQYKLCVKAGGCQKPSTLSPYYSDNQHGDYPVVFVTWVDANSYCQWAERRLPTEAEWEKAARGTDGRTYPWGEAIGTEYANYNTSPGDVTRVGSYELGKSPYGSYDMAGNVGEWVADLYDPNYYKTLGENAINPQGPSFGDGHVIRGGGPFYNDIQSANRDAGDRATNATGFRCALSVESTTLPEVTLTSTILPVTFTPVSALTQSPFIACDKDHTADFQFVTDVTVPDGTEMNPGQVFLKTWRIRNSGSCSWEEGYALVFTFGNKMSGEPQRLLEVIALGQEVDVSVQFIAPTQKGEYESMWRMADTNGTMFGDALFVKIVVK